MPTDPNLNDCCGRGGARPGCGRKPGVKTRPVRLPQWLLNELQRQGDARQAIIDACIAHYQLENLRSSEETND